MKPQLRFLLLILFVSLFPLVGIFATPKLLHTHDGLVHLPRVAAYFKALRDGEFPVRWAGDLNYGYGMPLFNYMYQTPYLIASFFVVIGAGLVNSFKIALSLSFLISGVGMFLFAKEFFGDNKKAFLVTIFYQFSPFRFVELLVRGSFGEVYTYAFFPFVLWGIVRLFKKNSYQNFLIVGISAGLLILSHNALSLVFYAIAVAFAFIFTNKIRTIFYATGALLIGLLLAAFYWVPAILEHKYTYGDLFMQSLYLSHFAPLQNFFIPNFTNDAHLQTGGISVQIGLFHTLAIILSIVLLFAKKTEKPLKKIITANLVLLLIVFFFMQPASKFVWAHVTLLRQFQFPWRILGVASFATSFLAISFFSFGFFQKKWVYVALVALVIFTTAYYWKPPLGYDKINENYYWNFPLNTTYYGETDLIWSAGPAHSYPKKPVEFIAGKGTVNNYAKRTTLHTFTVIANTNAALVDHTQYFPGWRVYVDGVIVPIQFQDANWRGQITFPLAQGKHTVKVVFGEDALRTVADAVSIIAVVTLIILGILRKRVFYENKRK